MKTNCLSFSELTEAEKQKYIDFMIENGIQLEEDNQSNSYLANIRIKPPKNKKCISPIHTKTSTLRNQKAINDKMNQKKYPESFVLAESKRNELSFSMNANYISRQLFYEQLMKKDKILGKPQQVSDKLKNVFLQQTIPQPIDSKSFRSKSANTIEKFEATITNTDEDDALIPQTLSNEKNFKFHFEEIIELCINRYKHFFSFYDFNKIDYISRPRKLTIDIMSKIIEEIYALKFLKETAYLKANITNNTTLNNTEEIDSALKFPKFVFLYFKEKYNDKSKFELNVLAFVYSLIYLKEKYLQCQIFSEFLSENYDSEDLTFFLFARSTIEKELNILFNSKTYKSTNSILNLRQSQRILEIVYGKAEKDLINKIIKCIKGLLDSKPFDGPEKKITTYEFLEISLVDYHESRKKFAEKNTQKKQSNSSLLKTSYRKILTPTKADNTNNVSNISFRKYNQKSDQSLIVDDFDRKSLNETSPNVATTYRNTTTSPRLNSNNISANLENICNESNIIENHKSYSYFKQEYDSYNDISKKKDIQIDSNNLKTFPNQDFLQNKKKSISPFKNMNLKDKCEYLMLKKLKEFIKTMLTDNQDFNNQEIDYVNNQLYELLSRKLKALIDALFSFDKIKWLKALMIEEPNSSQINHIENLQRELRQLQKMKTDDITENDTLNFANKIFMTSELSSEIGKLIVEYTFSEEYQEEQ